MGWKNRGGRRYYYRSVRYGDRVASEYAGTIGVMTAVLDAEGRERRRAEGAELTALARRLDGENRAMAEVYERVEGVVRAAIEAAGYHRHHRGPWRKRRVAEPKTPAPAGKERTPFHERPSKEINAVLLRANHGDEKALPELRRFFDEAPEVMLKISHGDWAAWAAEAAVERLSGENLNLKEGLDRQLAKLAAELSGPDPTAVERLLVQRVLLCWLDLHELEVRHHRNVGEWTHRQAEHFDRRRSRAHKRYLSALKALASVRKLDLTAIQVNVSAPDPVAFPPNRPHVEIEYPEGSVESERGADRP